MRQFIFFILGGPSSSNLLVTSLMARCLGERFTNTLEPVIESLLIERNCTLRKLKTCDRRQVDRALVRKDREMRANNPTGIICSLILRRIRIIWVVRWRSDLIRGRKMAQAMGLESVAIRIARSPGDISEIDSTFDSDIVARDADCILPDFGPKGRLEQRTRDLAYEFSVKMPLDGKHDIRFGDPYGNPPEHPRLPPDLK